MSTFRSALSGKTFPNSQRIAGKAIDVNIRKLIARTHPEFGDADVISVHELNDLRRQFITETLDAQKGGLSALEQKVLETLQSDSILAENADASDAAALSTGQRIADNVAAFGGSWTFILSFLFFLLLWIAFNVFWLHNRGFDPYPFILLNLILSCIAALQAPVIMMSQNRQEEKDRERAKKDYMTNLKSELEIRGLHEKIDFLILQQQQQLFEIQQIQMDMLNDILNRLDEDKKKY